MPNTGTVFGHLALRFSAHPENIATEALAFVLRNSAAAANAFVQLVGTTGYVPPDHLAFVTQQVGVDGSIPDIKCIDPDGKLCIVVENKFWAGLTDNQPSTYLKELAPNHASMLLFVVPEARRRALWDELMSISRAADFQLGEPCASGAVWCATVNEHHRLALTTWSHVLAALATATSEEGEAQAHNDVLQLRGLCERMDSEAFLPIQREELTNLELPRRMMDFAALPFDIIQGAEAKRLCDTRGQRETSSRYGAGKYARIGSFNPWVAFDAAAWRQLGASPLWIHFTPDYSDTREVRKRLAHLRAAEPPRCFDYGSYVSVPIFLLPNAERDLVVEDAVRQIGEIAAILTKNVEAASATASA